jgi:heterodisulfide reductase subunit D
MDGILDELDRTVADAASRCIRCGKCVEACPTAALIGLDKEEAPSIAAGLAGLAQGAAAPEARRWVEACNGSGQCTSACPEGIEVRQWVSIERMRLRFASDAAARAEAARRRFRSMAHSVRLLSSMQVPSDALAKITAQGRGRKVEHVFYTGCNVLRTPHLIFNVMDILDALDTSYEVMGGPGHCCGVYHFHEGDLETYAKVAGHTYGRFEAVGAKRVLSWCPSCTKQLGENWHQYADPAFEFGHIAKFFLERLDAMKARFRADLPRRRVAIHEHDGISGVAPAVRQLVAAIPGIELAEIAQDSGFGYVCGGPAARHPERERAAHRKVAENAAAAGVDVLVTIYHACHRALSGAEAAYPFEVKNFTDLLAEALGLGGRHDYYKQYKRGGEMDDAIDAARRYLGENGVALDEATVKALTAEIFNEVGISGDRARFEESLLPLAQHRDGPPS